MKESFILYKSFYDPIKGLSDEEKARILDSIFSYHISGEVPEMSPVCQMAFSFIKSQFDRDDEKYQAIIHRNRNNGIKGGRPSKNPGEPKKPSGLIGTSENPGEPKKADNDNDNDIKRKYTKRKTFLLPTLDEFKAYFRTNGFPDELAERAFKGYAENNWHDSEGKQVKNWKQKCQFNWFKPENKKNGKSQPELFPPKIPVL